MTTYLQEETWARVVFGISVAAFLVGELSQTLTRRRGARIADLPGEVVFRIAFFAGILMMPLGRSLAPGAGLPGPGVFVIGATIGWLGLLLRWWSFATLGSYFTTVVMTSPDQPVVDRGPYRILRHPSYTGLLAAVLGVGLMLGNWAGAAASFLVILLALVWRLRREERALVEALGSAYLEFVRDRARLVPFVW